jgi:DNA repair protein RadC
MLAGIPSARSVRPSRHSRRQPDPDEPAKRLAQLGPQALSHRELLMLLLAHGSERAQAYAAASAIVEAFAGSAGTLNLRALGATHVHRLAELAGVGEATAARVLAALELGRRGADEFRPDLDRILTARDVYDHMRLRMRDLEQEEFWIFALNTQREIVREVMLTRGTLTQSLVHAREVFRTAIEASAAAIVLIHNHPSGEPAPSLEDRAVTADLVATGDLVGIPVADHVIVGEGRFYSFNEHGELRSSRSKR